jgi:hypothetical protein
MKKLRAQHYILVLAALLAIASSLLAYFFMYKGAVGLAEAADRARANAVLASTEAVTMQKSQEFYASTTGNRSLLPTLLVPEGNAVPFIDEVEAIGPLSGASVSLSSLSSGMDAVSSHPIVSARVSIGGTWPQVMSAVQGVEDLPYAISVTAISLGQSGDADLTPKKTASHWSASLDISVLSSP